MRWFACLVAFCLVAAGVARPPAPLTLDRHDASVEDASELATLVSRRPTSLTTDKRTDRRIDTHLAAVLIVARPLAFTIVASAAPHAACTTGPRCLARSSRGPPVATATESSLTS